MILVGSIATIAPSPLHCWHAPCGELKEKFLKGDIEQQITINEKVNTINHEVQRLQREAGHSFVSRTTLETEDFPGHNIVVLRCVIMNPMTTIEILRDILDEQEEIYQQAFPRLDP